MSFDNIAAVIELCIIAFVTPVCSVAPQFQPLPENSWTSKRSQVQNPFISFANHVMFHISWIKHVCVCLCTLDLAGDFNSPSSLFTFQQSHPLVLSFSLYLLSPYLVSPALSLSSPPTVLPGSAVPTSVHSLGSTGSETVTQSSLVIGHGHANQTGRNLQLIRILPPAIIAPLLLTPCPHEINYIWGSIPTIGFPVLKLHYKGTNPKTTRPS